MIKQDSKYKRGKFIILEGTDGAGKTSVIKEIKDKLKNRFPKETFVFTREPGNLINPNGKSEEIRNMLLTNCALNPFQQARLFAEARYHHTLDIVKEIEKGHNVICDRYIFSSIAYQGIELGFKNIMDMNKQSLDLLKENWIDLHNIVLTIDKETYDARLSTREKDAMENVDDKIVIARINACSKAIQINQEQLQHQLGSIALVDARENLLTVTNNVLNIIDEILPTFG